MSGFCLEGPAERRECWCAVFGGAGGGGGNIRAETTGKRCVKEDQTWITSCSTHPLRPNAFGVMRSCLLQMWVGG